MSWQLGEVVETRTETPRARSLTLLMPGWHGYRAGQHVDVRLTAEDGYQAERSYSIASPPEDTPRVTITVERLDDGEVSPYLVDEVRVADHLEVRGPSVATSSGRRRLAGRSSSSAVDLGSCP